MSLFGQLTLKTRLALMMSVLIGLISLTLLVYLPARARTAAVQSFEESALALARMAAHGLGEGGAAGEPMAAAPIIRSLQGNPNLAYLVIVDPEGRVVTAFNDLLARSARYDQIEMSERGGAAGARGGFAEDGRIYQASAPIRVRGRAVGHVFIGLSMAQLEAQIASGRRFGILAASVILLVGITGSFILATLFTAPVRKMVKVTERIAAGSRGERANVGNEDEVGRLATSFNKMIDKLEDAQSALENANAHLEARVIERTRELGESEEKYRLMLERNLAGVYVTRPDGTVVTSNLACARLFGFDSIEQFVESGRINYADPDQREEVEEIMERDGQVTNVEVQFTTRNGRPFWALQNASVVGSPPCVEGILLDITDRKSAEAEIAFRAHHDPLTRLPNRHLLRDRLEMAIAAAKRRQRSVGVLFLDVDDLKGINDTLGHPAGDEVLQMIGVRLKSSLRAMDTVGRIGGDEFAVVLPDLESEDMVQGITEKLLASLEPPLLLNEEEVRVSASVGVAVFPRDGNDPETLLRNADATMYKIKELGGQGFRVFHHQQTGRGIHRSTLEADLRRGIERDEFVVYYQPQVNLATQTLCGVEALVRWNHPDGVQVPPTAFIPIAEQTGLILPIGERVLRQACEDLRRWQAAGHMDLQVGVNVSARQFHQKNFVGMVGSLVRELAIDPSKIELEITETLAIQKSGWTLQLLEELRALGLRIAVDDFGTGRSSLVYLKKFPIDTVKIDKQFIQGMLVDPHDESIVSAILLLADRLSLRTVAEGVENEAQCSFLTAAGCREVQGFYFSRAVPVAGIDEMLLRGGILESAEARQAIDA